MDSKNIIDIHNAIIQSFLDEEKMLPVLQKRITDLKNLYDDEKMSTRLKDDILKDVQECSDRYEKISTKRDMHFYILESTLLLEEYKKELSNTVEINFMGQRINTDTSKIDKIHYEFMNLIKKFRLVKSTVSKCDTECPTCHNTLDESIVDNSSTIACKHCGTEKDVLQLTFSYKDTDRINITSKYTYDRRVHFRECINQFQGKQNSTIRPEVYSKLIEQLELYGLVREGDLPQKIKYEQVTKDHISLFLKEIGYVNHYEDLNLIYHTITGNELDDISHLEDALMDDFDKLSNIYNEEYVKTNKISRKNFINTQYVLYQLLKRRKYPCSKKDFSFLKTIERKGFHDDICSHLFKLLSWNFKPAL